MGRAFKAVHEDLIMKFDPPAIRTIIYDAEGSFQELMQGPKVLDEVAPGQHEAVLKTLQD
jgi:hypothetical protein